MNSQEPPVVRVNRPKTPARTRPRGRWDWPFRLVIVALLAGSVALAWWSMRRLEPLQKRSRELTSTVDRLSTQVDELEAKWARGQDEEVGDQLRQAHARLFSDQAALENWLTGLKEQTEPLSLETKATFGKTISQNAAEEEVAMIPTTISLDIRPAREPDGITSPYLRLVQLSQRLLQKEKRADLVELTVEGGTNSVTSAVLVLNLWAGTGAQR